MKNSPKRVIHYLASQYRLDAIHNRDRFDCLWEHGRLMSKLPRTKSFVDLMLGCECILKAHILLGNQGEDPLKLYCRLKKMGHDIGALSQDANFMTDRTHYNLLKDRSIDKYIYLRYSLDAQERYYPSALIDDGSEIEYSRTIGNHMWVHEIRDTLEALILPANQALNASDDNTDNFKDILEHLNTVGLFMESAKIRITS